MNTHYLVILALMLIVVGASFYRDPIKQVRGMLWAVLLMLAYLMDTIQ
jgi:uncharacterized membrane protein YbaN (DUF454 family)